MARTAERHPKKGHQPRHGEGSFYYDARLKVWRGTYDAGYSNDGVRRRVTASAKDEDEAWQKFIARRKDVDLDRDAGPGVRVNETVSEWCKVWLEQYHDSGVRPRVYATVRSQVQSHIVPTLGRVQLRELKASDLQKLAAAVRRRGAGRTMAAHVQRTFLQILKAARADERRIPDGILAAKRATPGRSLRVAPKADVLVSLLRQAWEDLPDHSRWDMALMQGLRQGEALGLTWDRVDLESGEVHVSWQLQSLPYLDRASGTFDIHPDVEAVHLTHAFHLTRPKTEAGERVVPMIPEMVAVMAAWREVAPENEWGLVWPRLDDPSMPRNSRHDLDQWKRLQDAAGVQKAGGGYYVGHELRHATISLLSAAGVPKHVIERIVGQTELVKSYVHADADQMREALTSLRSVFGQIEA